MMIYYLDAFGYKEQKIGQIESDDFFQLPKYQDIRLFYENVTISTKLGQCHILEVYIDISFIDFIPFIYLLDYLYSSNNYRIPDKKNQEN